MIGRLVGEIAEKNEEGVVLDVQGVGYDVALPVGALARLPELGSRLTVYIHTHVREDELKLFGFLSRADRAAFRDMLRVSGVGPKVALGVLGELSGAELSRVVARADTKRLAAIHGIGKKTAERLVLELAGKLVLTDDEAPRPLAATSLDAVASALRNMGFKPAHVDRVVARLADERTADVPLAELVRRGLTILNEG